MAGPSLHVKHHSCGPGVLAVFIMIKSHWVELHFGKAEMDAVEQWHELLATSDSALKLV